MKALNGNYIIESIVTIFARKEHKIKYVWLCNHRKTRIKD
jgi:hypothetical protein